MNGPLQAYATFIQNATGLPGEASLLIIGMLPLAIMAGYKIDFRKSIREMAEIGVPTAWLVFNLIVIWALFIDNPLQLATRNITAGLLLTITGAVFMFALNSGREED